MQKRVGVVPTYGGCSMYKLAGVSEYTKVVHDYNDVYLLCMAKYIEGSVFDVQNIVLEILSIVYKYAGSLY